MNKLEKFQQKTIGIKYIKSYFIMNLFPLSEKQLIELILSFEDNGKQFNMKFSNIADLLNIKIQSVKNIVSKHKKTGIFITINKSNYNNFNGGSHTLISVDQDKLISIIKEIINKQKDNSQNNLNKSDNFENKSLYFEKVGYDDLSTESREKSSKIIKQKYPIKIFNKLMSLEKKK